MAFGMAGAVEKVGVQAVVDGFRPYMQKLGMMEAKTKGWGSKIGSFLKKGALIGGAALLGLGAIAVKLGNDFVNLASDYEESLSKTRIVFGESAKAVEAFAKTAATSLGMAEGKTLEATATFGNFLTAMGQAPEEAAKLSINMVTLAGDMASFNNASPEEVLLALRSGLSGEAEPLKRFGVALNETTMKAKATELGLTGVNGVLTEGEKIQARYALIMEQTGTAQGDFARTSDGLANKQRILAAQMEDLKVKIGRKLLPVKLALANFVMKKVIPAMTKLFDVIDKKVVPVLKRDLIPRIKDIVRALIRFFVPALDTLRDAWVNVGRPIANLVLPILKKFGEWIGGNKEVIRAFGIALSILAGAWAVYTAAQLAATVAAIAFSAVPVVAAVAAIVLGLTALVLGITLLIKHWDEVKAAVDSVIRKFEELPVIGQIFRALQQVVKDKVDAIIGIARGIVDFAKELISFFKNVFSGEWGAAWTDLKDMAKIALGLFLDYLQLTFLGTLKSIFTALGLWDWAKGAFETFKTEASNFLNGVVDTVRGVGSDIAKALGEGLRGAIGWAKGALNALITQVEKGVNFIIRLINAIPDVKLPFGLGSIGIPNIGYVSVPRLHRGAFEIPQDMLARLQAGEMVLPRPQAEVVREAVLAPSVGPSVNLDAEKIGMAVARALQGITVEANQGTIVMDGEVVGRLISRRLGSTTDLLGRAG